MTQSETFSDLPEPIARALSARGFTSLTAVQRAVVDAEHEGRDLRISSQTGSGKTVAIGLALAAHFLDAPRRAAAASAPASDSDPEARETGLASPRRPLGPSVARPRALVIVPTRELAAQVREELRWLFAELPGATIEVVTGGTSILRERIALAKRPAFVVGTPGRLLDHLRNGALVCDAIEHVILDEADQMLDMGFKDELDAILEQLPAERQSHLVSATFPKAVKALADRFQKSALTLEGTKLGVANPDIQHVAYTIRRQDTFAALVNVLLLAGDSRCLLFVNRRLDATELAERLSVEGFGAAPFSGELPQAQRTRTLAAFRAGTLPILVSTDVAARGIDVPEIGTVIHVDPPRNPDAYVHRSGRTGRAGRAGRSILLIEANESRRVSRMLSATRVAVAWETIPNRDAVERVLDRRATKALAERLDEAVPNEVQRLAAKQLLTERDPIELVASLFLLAKERPPCAPRDVVGLDPFVDSGRGRRGRFERGDRPERPDRSDRPARRDRPGPGPRGDRESRDARRGGEAPRRAPQDFVAFELGWGEGANVTTARLLSHVCRRGGLKSDQVGAIRIFSKTARVEVDSGIADAFEARTRTPDERDPDISIVRSGAPGAPVRRPRPSREESREATRESPQRPMRPSLGMQAAEALDRHGAAKKKTFFKARRVERAEYAQRSERPASPTPVRKGKRMREGGAAGRGPRFGPSQDAASMGSATTRFRRERSGPPSGPRAATGRPPRHAPSAFAPRDRSPREPSSRDASPRDHSSHDVAARNRTKSKVKVKGKAKGREKAPHLRGPKSPRAD